MKDMFEKYKLHAGVSAVSIALTSLAFSFNNKDDELKALSECLSGVTQGDVNIEKITQDYAQATLRGDSKNYILAVDMSEERVPDENNVVQQSQEIKNGAVHQAVGNCARATIFHYPLTVLEHK